MDSGDLQQVLGSPKWVWGTPDESQRATDGIGEPQMGFGEPCEGSGSLVQTQEPQAVPRRGQGGAPSGLWGAPQADSGSLTGFGEP